MDSAKQAQTFTVVIGTYGKSVWTRLAQKRAIPSALSFGVPVIHEHCGTLAEARNLALSKVETEYVVHLDADDELAPGYIKAMTGCTGDILIPRVSICRNPRSVGHPHWPRVWGHTHECVAECLRYGNFIVVGAGVRTEIARAHGWEEFGWSEDWAMWARCVEAGATIERVPDAIYKAYKRIGSRNRVPRAVSLNWHREIERAVWPNEASVLT